MMKSNQVSAALEMQSLPALAAVLPRHLGNPFIGQAMDRAAEQVGKIEDIEQRITAINVLGHYFAMRGRPARGYTLLERVAGNLRTARLTPLAELNLLAVELLYAHHVFASADYASNQAKVQRCLRLAQASEIHSMDIPVVGHGIFLALKAGDAPQAQRLLAAAKALCDPARESDASHVALLQSAIAYTQGDFAVSHEHALECLRIASTNGSSFDIAQIHILIAHALWAMGRIDEARQAAETLLGAARGIGADCLEYVGLMLRSYFHLETCTGLEALRSAFDFGKRRGQMTPSPWCDLHVTHQLCEVALLNGIEPQFVRRTIERLGLRPRRQDIESWPWPVRIYTLGRFRIEIQGRALESFSKAQRRPLKLLKVLIAAGGRDVKVDDLLRVVWQSDAEDPRAAFDMALLRLRKLLGHADILSLSEGRVTLNDQLAWVDAWALEAALEHHLKRPLAELQSGLAAYRGHFLVEEGEEPWLLPTRDRLAAKFRSGIRRAAHDREHGGDWQAAAALYELGLQVDNITEEFYLRLMYCLKHLGRTSDALGVYRRCRHMLSVVLRARPALETEQLYHELIQS